VQKEIGIRSTLEMTHLESVQGPNMNDMLLWYASCGVLKSVWLSDLICHKMLALHVLSF